MIRNGRNGRWHNFVPNQKLAINPVIYAELSLAFTTVEALNNTVAAMELVLEELPRAALFLAGKAFVRYRREGGTKSNV